MGKITKTIQAIREAEALHGLLTWQPVQQFLWPLVIGPVVTAVLGLAGGVPMMWVWVAALASFAFMTHGLLRLNEWIDRTSANGKLDIIEPTIQITGAETVEPIEIASAQIGVSLGNRAIFPMEFRVERIDTRFADRVGSVKNYANRGGVIAPNSVSFFRDSAITIEKPRLILERKGYESRIDILISYGKPGGKRFTIERSFAISVFVDPTTKDSHVNWRPV